MNMGGPVLGGGAIVLVVAVLWLAYLVPSWQMKARYNAAERNAATLQVKHSSNGFDQGLRKQRVFRAAERECFAFRRIVENGGDILRGYAFHK